VTAPRATVVLVVHDRLDLTRACLESLRATREPFALAVVDNGSTDGTADFFATFSYPWPLHFERGPDNGPVIAALNRAWRLATTDVVCFLHNDTEMVDPQWLTRLLAALDAPGVGLAGLFGAKRLRRDGRSVGRTIVHSLADGPTVRSPWEEVVFVDSVCLCLRRALMEELRGFDEGYGFYHGHDRDLSLAVRERGLRCVVARAPFVHRGAGTRGRAFGGTPEGQAADLAMRAAAVERFARKWAHRLPADARSSGRRVREWVRAKLLSGGGG
jgi:O-antigen biosynthesis protein